MQVYSAVSGNFPPSVRLGHTSCSVTLIGTYAFGLAACISFFLGNACRTRVIKLKALHKSPNEAFSQNELTLAGAVGSEDCPEGSGSHDGTSSSASQMQVSPPESVSIQQPFEACSKSLVALPPTEKLAVLTQLCCGICKCTVETDFLQLAFCAMQHLKKNGRSNQLCKCVGTMRSDGSDSLLPVNRMPTGLIEYVVNFYSAQTIAKVRKVVKCRISFLFFNFMSTGCVSC